MIHELTRRVITRFVEDAIAESRARIAAAGVASLDDVRRAGRALVGFSPALAAADRDIKTLPVSPTCIAIPTSNGCASKPTAVVRALFSAYVADPDAMPPDWAGKAGASARRAGARRRRLHRRHDRPLRAR